MDNIAPTIRKAIPEDASFIASHILIAMEDIAYRFIGQNQSTIAHSFFRELAREKGNQYSYENCWVVESGKEIVGTAIVYDGAMLKELRNPVADKIKAMFSREFNPEDETQPGEYYIDCVGVDPGFQGRGIGTMIFQFLINEYVFKHNKTLGLLVEQENPGAKKLYLTLGFKKVGEKILTGKKMDHLQYKVNNTASSNISNKP